MPDYNPRFVTGITYLGQTFQSNFATTGANAADGAQPAGGVPAAKTGALTTRTNATDGTVTLDAGHGLTSGVFFIFWAGGSRYGVTGTVTVNALAITGGAGDDLPPLNTAVTVCKATEQVISVTGDDAVAAVAYAQLVPGDGDAYVQFTKSDDTVLATYQMDPDNPSGFWNGTGTNPFAGVTVGKVKFAHGKTSALVMGGAIPYA